MYKYLENTYNSALKSLSNGKNHKLLNINSIFFLIIIMIIIMIIWYVFKYNLNKINSEQNNLTTCKNSFNTLDSVFSPENMSKATHCTPNIFSLLDRTLMSKVYGDIPLIGFGTFQRAGNTANMSDVIYEAIKTGYRCFDCAVLYGNQYSIGVGIQRAITEGIVTREDLFIIGKGVSVYDFEISIRQLQIKKLDLALLHDFIGNDSWKDIMVKTKDCGLADKIGVANIYNNKLHNLLQYCDENLLEKPYLIENEINVFTPEDTLVEVCNKNNIKVIAHTPLARTCLNSLADEPVLEDLLKKYAPITLAQLVLLWNMRRGITVIPSSVNTTHIEENYSTYKDLLKTNILTPDEVKSITNINGPDGSPTIQISFGAKKFDNSDKNYIILQYYK